MRRPLPVLLVVASLVLAVWLVPRLWTALSVRRELYRLHSEEPDRRVAAKEALRARGAAVVPELVDALGARDPSVEPELLELLRVADSAAAVEEVSRGLTSADPGRRQESARLLGWLGDAHAIPELLPLLSDSEEDVVRAAVVSLAMLKAEEARAPLREMLVSGAATLRGVAAYGLGQLGDRESRSLLERALGDPNEYVRREAHLALESMGFLPAAEAPPQETPK